MLLHCAEGVFGKWEQRKVLLLPAVELKFDKFGKEYCTLHLERNPNFYNFIELMLLKVCPFLCQRTTDRRISWREVEREAFFWGRQSRGALVSFIFSSIVASNLHMLFCCLFVKFNLLHTTLFIQFYWHIYTVHLVWIVTPFSVSSSCRTLVEALRNIEMWEENLRWLD